MKRFGTLGTTFTIGVGIATVAIAVVAASSGKQQPPSKETTESALRDFRARWTRGEFAQLYAGAAPEFRAGAEEALFVKAMQRISEKLGPLQSAKPLDVKKVAGNEGKVMFEYQSQFANGEATERFVWRSEAGKPLLVGYHVNSKALGL